MSTDLHRRDTTPTDDTDAQPSLSWEQMRADLIAAQSGTPSHAASRGHVRWKVPPSQTQAGCGGNIKRPSRPRRGIELQKVDTDTPPRDEALPTPQAHPYTAGRPATGMERLTVTHVRSQELGLVSVDGVLGEATRETLCQALREAVEASGPDSQVAVDLQRAEFADDSAYSALVSAHLRLSGLGRRLFVVLEAGGAGAAWIVHMGLDTLLTRVDTAASLAKLRLPRRDTGKRP